MSKPLYHVRQYRPNYFSGFENEVYHNVSWEVITAVPFMANFRHGKFQRFEIEPYGKEFIISAIFSDGESWVAAFAVSADHEFAKDWRYA